MLADLRVGGHDQVQQVAQRAAGRATVDEQVTVIAGGVHEEIDGVFAGAGVEVHHRRSRLALNIESVCRAAAVDGEPCQVAVGQSAARPEEMIALGGPDLAGGDGHSLGLVAACVVERQAIAPLASVDCQAADDAVHRAAGSRAVGIDDDGVVAVARLDDGGGAGQRPADRDHVLARTGLDGQLRHHGVDHAAAPLKESITAAGADVAWSERQPLILAVAGVVHEQLIRPALAVDRHQTADAVHQARAGADREVVRAHAAVDRYAGLFVRGADEDRVASLAEVQGHRGEAGIGQAARPKEEVARTEADRRRGQRDLLGLCVVEVVQS